jgi:hypothetical protein
MAFAYGAEVLAHAGAWDEILYFVVPIVVALSAIRWANKRAMRAEAENAASDDDEGADVSG